MCTIEVAARSPSAGNPQKSLRRAVIAGRFSNNRAAVCGIQRAMRILVLLVVVSRVAFAGPPTCPKGEKRFHCHERALRAHLDGDLATARVLYREACDMGEAASCNNLGVLALRDGGPDAKPLFDKACARMEPVACNNARRLATHEDLAVELALGGTELTLGADAWKQLVIDACRAGDVFRCDDAASRARVAGVLADECHAGTQGACADAAAHTADEAAATALLVLGCKAHDGKACHALAAKKPTAELWKGSCTDKDWSVGSDENEQRTDDCVHWAKAAHSRRAADLAADACNGCMAAAEAYDAVGDHARAFALADKLCTELSQADACRDVGERMVLGKGTRVDVAAGFEKLGNTCPEDLAWSTCKRIGQWLVAHGRAADAGTSYTSACKAGNTEACYLQARAYEVGPHGSCTRGPYLGDLAKTYDDLCKQGDRAACGARPRLCARAMAEDVKEHQCGFGIGDASVNLDLEDAEVLELCPKTAWTPAVRKRMKDFEQACREAPGRARLDSPDCDRWDPR